MRQRGFTLIELMVAVFITAILFAIGYGAVNQAVKNREALEQQQERLLAIQTAVRTIAQDVNQLALRIAESRVVILQQLEDNARSLD